MSRTVRLSVKQEKQEMQWMSGNARIEKVQWFFCNLIAASVS